ncbi:hypothetical protein [Myxococcus sp. RHSTA-1-4]|nr:hypothetical protein [Myxococcus sp. RHSTA-1-4]MBZ4420216.1 hypothetical protein [Myxococcus sp. RHSTA-1-4]
MLVELLIGVVLMTALIVVLGPALWSSRLSITEEQKQWEEQSRKRPRSDT